jgi:hypothetical protein
VELNEKNQTVLYVPPISPAAVLLGLEYSIELSLNCNADAVIVVSDFSDNQLNPHCRKIKDSMILYNLHQLINEATNFTEHRQSLIDLILTISVKIVLLIEPNLMEQPFCACMFSIHH